MYRLKHNVRRYVLVGVTRRIPAEPQISFLYSKLLSVGKGGFGACFCRHGTNFIEFWRDRGTILIGAANLSPVTNLVRYTGAVSRYKLSRSQKTVKVYEILIVSRCACPGADTITNLS
jgi:hypothetical protein